MTSQDIWIFVIILATNVIATQGGIATVITVPEGPRNCPVEIATFPLYGDEVRCEVSKVNLARPGTSPKPQVPKLFGADVKQMTSSDKIIKRSIDNFNSTGTAATMESLGSSTRAHELETTTESLKTYSTVPAVSTYEPSNYTSEFPHSTYASKQFQTTSSLHTPPTANTQSTIAYVVPTQTSNGSIPSFQGRLLQLYDLDREKADRHLVTVRCFRSNGKQSDFPYLFEITVSDMNDNSPIFEEKSLHSTVPTNVMLGDQVMQLKATDADIGLNSQLVFDSVMGSERLKYANQTKYVHASRGTVLVLASGFVLMGSDFYRDVTITFKAVVKDRGDRNDGNRVTATATISLYSEGIPATNKTTPTPDFVPDVAIKWWVIAVPCVVGTLVIATLAIVISRKIQRMKMTNHALLVIDDEFNDDNQRLEFLP
ncbi:unnamed protein product [Clavelina lepadiformis]|uniref:Cadherin domain-containing protein n=1 Tax=Clavelina lepadiformis TaxID=159417 RepID=A0ABP0GRR2_CLALP